MYGSMSHQDSYLLVSWLLSSCLGGMCGGGRRTESCILFVTHLSVEGTWRSPVCIPLPYPQQVFISLVRKRLKPASKSVGEIRRASRKAKEHSTGSPGNVKWKEAAIFGHCLPPSYSCRAPGTS